MKLPIKTGKAQLGPAERWADPKETYGHANPQRAREVADKLLAFGVSSVLDIGCGNMKLGEYLAEHGVGYVPADVVSRSPECLVVDLDRDPVPLCEAECVVMVGVQEFLEDPARVLADVAGKYPRILITLSPLQTIYEQVWPGRPHRIASTHTSAFSLKDYKSLFSRHFAIEDIDVMSNGQYLLLGRSKRHAKAAPGAAAPVPQPGVTSNDIDFGLLAAGGFEAHIFKSVPFHGVFLRTAAMLAAAVVRPGSVCVDLGCSTGRFARILRRQLRDVAPVRIVAVDNAPEMIAEARRRDRSPLTEYILDDVVDFDIPAPASFVSSLFTLQFLDLEERRAVLARIHAALEWRGAAVVAEKVLEASGKAQMTNHYLLNAYKRDMGLTDAEVLEKERAVRSALRPLDREANERLFREAGFRSVHVAMAAFGWELTLLEKV
jgi:tRNA (cmo5U34)-methyltransferase